MNCPCYDDRGDRRSGSPSEAYPAADIVLIPLPPRTYDGTGPARLHRGAYARRHPHSADVGRHAPRLSLRVLRSESTFCRSGRPATSPASRAWTSKAGPVVPGRRLGVSGHVGIARSWRSRTACMKRKTASMRSGRIWKLLGIFSAMPVVRERDRPAAGIHLESVADCGPRPELPAEAPNPPERHPASARTERGSQGSARASLPSPKATATGCGNEE